MTASFDTADALAAAVIRDVGPRLVVGLPVGIGKALHVADALYRRVAADASLSLTIFTGLTLEIPRGRSDLERRFLEPYTERAYADWPEPLYARAVRRQELPDNIEVREFYLRPGAYLGNPLVQQCYTSINYSQVVAELQRLGVNVVAQLVSARPQSAGRYSLGSNPEITLDLLTAYAAQQREGRKVALIGEVNRSMPYMTGEAELASADFDYLLDDGTDYPLFGLPARPVSSADYATAMHVASLVPDGGTLQVGIGSLSDALAHCLRLRHENPDVFADVLAKLPGGSSAQRRGELPLHLEPFEQGLFASSELLSDALFALFESGIVKRAADASDNAVIHAGFFVGTSAFYERLRQLDEARREQIRMTRISEVNTLFGDENAKRRQRRGARFINETMMVTLLGAAISDGLRGGRVVSGVGGQFDFVNMAQSLPDARSILMCRASRMNNGAAESNFRWSYPHATVPRHCRDMFVSEYGIADTRGRPDKDVIARILSIADAAFQEGLAEEARDARKLPPGFTLTADAGRNTPEVLERIFSAAAVRPHFPPYPLGTDFTDVEQQLVAALQELKLRTARPTATLKSVAAAVLHKPASDQSVPLARMALDAPSGWRDKLTARLLAHALEGQEQ